MDHHSAADSLQYRYHDLQVLEIVPRRDQCADLHYSHDHLHISREPEIPGVARQDRRSTRGSPRDLRGEHRAR